MSGKTVRRCFLLTILMSSFATISIVDAQDADEPDGMKGQATPTATERGSFALLGSSSLDIRSYLRPERRTAGGPGRAWWVTCRSRPVLIYEGSNELWADGTLGQGAVNGAYSTEWNAQKSYQRALLCPDPVSWPGTSLEAYEHLDRGTRDLVSASMDRSEWIEFRRSVRQFEVALAAWSSPQVVNRNLPEAFVSFEFLR